MVRALRPHHWVKNLLVALPVLMAHQIGTPEAWTRLLAAFGSFCLAASGMYVLNDLADADADRHHPTKRTRPFASRALQPATGVAAAAVLTGGALALGWGVVSARFGAVIGVYVALTGLYSAGLKRVPVLDVLVLAGLYTWRVIAGGVATDTPLSPWLLSFATYFFLSLAMLKRYTELRPFAARGDQDAPRGRGYRPPDLDLVRTVGPASGYLSVLVLSLYLNSETVLLLYRRPAVLWLLTPLFLFWVTRVWLLAHRGAVDDDPLVFAVRDLPSYAVGALVVAVLIIATG